jgi:hypothetical protein
MASPIGALPDGFVSALMRFSTLTANMSGFSRPASVGRGFRPRSREWPDMEWIIEAVVIWVLVSVPLGCCIGTVLREMDHG